MFTKESSYIFRDGMLPPHRQMFYQLCDLDEERYVMEYKLHSGDCILLTPCEYILNALITPPTLALDRWLIRTVARKRCAMSATAGACLAPRTS